MGDCFAFLIQSFLTKLADHLPYLTSGLIFFKYLNMYKLFCSIIFLFPALTYSQNVGVGTTNPQQQLHVAGNIRVDGLAGTSGIVKYNNTGDLVTLPNSGNASQALLGNGTWGTVPGTVPTGAIVATTLYDDPNLVNNGYSLFGFLPGFTRYVSSNIVAAPNTWSPTYVEGSIGKYNPPNFDGNDIYFWVDSVLYTFANNSFYIYNPISNSWRFGFANPTSFSASFECQMVWTGTELIVWGGNYTNANNNGFRYNPTTNTWLAIPTTGQPSARSEFSMHYVNGRLVVWGGEGFSSTLLNDGAVLNLATNTWTAITATGALSARYLFSSVVNSSNNTVIMWGGQNSPSFATVVGDGAIYNPQTNTWTPITSTNAPIGRSRNVAVWTGSEMIIHGGFGGNTSLTYLNSGARYNPTTNTWTTMSLTASPRREYHSGIWIGTKMLISGGSDNIFGIVGAPFQSSAHTYDPITDSWQTAGSMGVNKAFHKLIMGNDILLCFGGSTMILNPITSDYTNYIGVPNGSRYFLNSTATNQTLALNGSKLYLYMRQ